jgi:hypothetical protein
MTLICRSQLTTRVYLCLCKWTEAIIVNVLTGRATTDVDGTDLDEPLLETHGLPPLCALQKHPLGYICVTLIATDKFIVCLCVDTVVALCLCYWLFPGLQLMMLARA